MPRTNTRRRSPGSHAVGRLNEIERELERWRKRAVPDANAPLDADDVARLARDCFATFDLHAAAESFSVNTVHYYRRKDVLDEPEGRTAAARYALRHVWQAVGARLAGHLGLVTLAEARDAIRDAAEEDLRRFVAARLADARAREAARQPAVDARPLGGEPAAAARSSPLTATVVPLGQNALCLIPSGHEALRSPGAARQLVNSLARQLGLDS
ncbi:MAG TPA: hypothetical protein VH277_01385 [Gemmatimonadaceae bacterium]|jgi:hypothetical protein|nr:hypothetical protein [Gemmatimonadaceae bacterium]